MAAGPVDARDFVGVYDNALPPDLCEEIIARFEASDGKGPGHTGHGLDVDKKDSLDLAISGLQGWSDVCMAVAHFTHPRLADYVRRYPFLLAGAVCLAVPGLDGRPRWITHDMVASMGTEDRDALSRAVFRLGTLNCQRYTRGRGGYHHWHSEVFPPPGDGPADTLHRVLLFMYYLNDVEDGGETSFYFQGRDVAARAGRLVIAPAGFTHTHKGQIPRSSDKYILTSWVLFRDSADLYNAPPG